jgi:hypothetical protein
MDNVWNVNVVFNATDHSFSFQGNCTPDGFMYALSGVKSFYLVTLSTINGSSQFAELTGINVQDGTPVTVLPKTYTSMGRTWPCYMLVYDGTVTPTVPACFSLTLTFMGVQIVVPDPTIINVEPPNP